MKKIRISILFAGDEDYPGCADILASCLEFETVGQHSLLDAPGVWRDLSRSDVILLDEAAVSQEGAARIREIHDSFPFARILLIIEKNSRNKTMEALAMGITGIMEQASILGSIRKAIPVLYSGETWISRGLVDSLRTQLNYAGDESFFTSLDTRFNGMKN